MKCIPTERIYVYNDIVELSETFLMETQHVSSVSTVGAFITCSYDYFVFMFRQRKIFG